MPTDADANWKSAGSWKSAGHIWTCHVLREAEHTCLGNIKKYLKTDILFRILTGYELGESSPGQVKNLQTTTI
jgi:hypothetical protein